MTSGAGGGGAAVGGSIEAIAIGPVTPIVVATLTSSMCSGSVIMCSIMCSMWSILTPSPSVYGPE